MRDVMTGDKAPCCYMLIKNIEAEVTFPPLPSPPSPRKGNDCVQKKKKKSP